MVCIVVHYCCWFLIVGSYIVLFRPLLDVLFSVPSLQIQLYSCCFSHSSGFGSVGGACVKMFIVTVFFVVAGFLKVFVYQARCVYPTFWVFHIFVVRVLRYTMFFWERL